MSCYEALAGSYDALTTDVDYEKRADFLEKLLRRSAIPVRLVLDLACGTGTMTWLLTQRGYEVIGVDGSEEMLAAAMSKSGQAAGIPPVFLHQSMPRLDLYGTVDAAVCCLDSLNYLTDPADVRAAINAFCAVYDESDDSTAWFDKIKSIADSLGYASDMKAYKQNPSAFRGSVADISSFLRLAVTGRLNAPDLYTVMHLLGRSRTLSRLTAFAEGAGKRTLGDS